ncbi:uncharacterized protein LOC120326881 [Styela clava]
MENLNVNPTLAEGDLLELSPLKLPNSILKPSQKDNLIMLQTPVHKQLKVSFITPKRTPLLGQKGGLILNPSATALQEITPINGSYSGSENVPAVARKMVPPSKITDTPKTGNGMPAIKKGIAPRRPGVSSQEVAKNEEEKSSQKNKNDNKWESLRKLDENLRWRERVEVITKLDHQEYKECAKEYVNEMIDKAIDISISKANKSQPEGSKDMTSMTNVITPISVPIPPSALPDSEVMTPASKIMTPISKVCDSNAVISPIAKTVTQRSNVMTPGTEIMTPNMCGMNATLDISDHGSFIADKTDNEGSATPSVTIKPNTSGLRHPSALRKPMSVRPKTTRPKSKSQSTLDEESVGPNQNGSKHPFNLGTRAYSFDLDNIPEDFDPFSPKNALKPNPNSRDQQDLQGAVKEDSSLDALNTSANVSVFELAPQASNYALREVDVTFGNSAFVDGSKLLEQGQLDLDFLEQQTPGGISGDLRKQSLYMKFDPLLQGLVNRQSLVLLGRKSDIIDFTGRVTPVPEDVAEEPAIISPREPDLLCDSPSQIGVDQSIFEASNVARGSASDSIGSVSPGFQHPTALKPDNGIIEVLKYSEADIQRVLKRKKEKWALERDEAEKRYNDLVDETRSAEIAAKDCVERYEKRLNELEEEKKHNKEEFTFYTEEKKKIDLKFKNLTRSSSVLFQKTETLQKMTTNLQANELKQKEYITEFRAKCMASQKKSIELEKETTETLKKISAEKAEVEANFAAQLNNIQMKIRTVELRVKSLQTELDHKKDDNKELMKLCDELVGMQ